MTRISSYKGSRLSDCTNAQTIRTRWSGDNNWSSARMHLDLTTVGAFDTGGGGIVFRIHNHLFSAIAQMVQSYINKFTAYPRVPRVYGTGGPVPAVKPLPSPAADGTWDLSGGWKLFSESFVHDNDGKVSTCGYDNGRWLPATVPGTVLTSYLNAGAVPDMFYGDQQFQVSDWFCRSDWWYRTELELPESYRGRRVWLNFDGINYTADIFVNGRIVGKMAGAFIRGRFDVTDKGPSAGRIASPC